MTNTIKCPYCNREFEVTEALKHQIKEELSASMDEKHKKEIEKVKLEAEEKAKEKISIELKDKDQQIESLAERVEKAEQEELKIRKEKQELKEAKDKFELEKQRQLDEEREKIRAAAIEEVHEKDKYKFADYEKKIADMKKSLEDANRRAEQGSQQSQGETPELLLEQTLRSLFPVDEILEVKKGEMGADIRQCVKTARGTVCGIILWESKRTKAWSDTWLTKLKEDIRRDNAHLGIIITEVLPSEFKKQIGNKDGIWITTPAFVEPLAHLLRKNLYDVAKEKAIKSLKQDKAGELYDLVTSNAFAQQIERMVEIYFYMKLQVNRERATSEKQWKQRETQIDLLITGVSGIYGSMQGIAGTALPQIKMLDAGDEFSEKE